MSVLGDLGTALAPLMIFGSVPRGGHAPGGEQNLELSSLRPRGRLTFSTFPDFLGDRAATT
jgi:hypothetical protein